VGDGSIPLVLMVSREQATFETVVKEKMYVVLVAFTAMVLLENSHFFPIKD
jgi:hypothetical protein